MDPDGVERKLAAILSADVAGYSRLMAEDEVATLRSLTAYLEQIGVLVRQHRGQVVDAEGDNLLAEFPSAVDAVRCAVEVQRVLQARNADLPPERKMEFRIGLHLGDVMVEGDRIYGDGVNIAARLEGLAEPGGICISDMVYKQVQRKLGVGYEDLGKQELKNIPDPVQAYRVRLEPEASISTESLPGMDELTVPGFGGRPAIAVLPFDNLSGDPDQEYFADGIAEDLITRLSAWRDFPVIARNSSFVYKGKAVDVKQVSRELGVRYVVEGSVRKAGDRVRISAQLVDASTGHHVWAERYDRELSDIFTVQDEITEAIATSMQPGLFQSELDRAIRREPKNLDAYDLTMRGLWHSFRLTKDDNAKARALFERAIELDPNSGLAFAGVATTCNFDLRFQWSDSPKRTVDEMVQAAEKSVALDDQFFGGQLALGWAYTATGHAEKAISAFELAVQLNPSNAAGYFGLGSALANAGRADEGIANMEKAMRLSPKDPLMSVHLFLMAFAHFAAEQYEEAIHWCSQSLQRRPDDAAPYRVLAASYAHLGQLHEARTALDEMLRRQPDFSVSTLRLFQSAADPAILDRYVDGLRKAGLKE